MGLQQYFINKEIQSALQKSKDKTRDLSSVKINKVAIFVDEKTVFNEEAYKDLQKIIKLDSFHFNIITFKTKKSSFNEFRGAVVHQSDINWKAGITSEAVKYFINKSYDLLIDYTQADNLLKQLIVAKIKASIKVGFSDKNDELYDFMIAVNPAKIKLFNKEMVHYLTILNLI